MDPQSHDAPQPEHVVAFFQKHRTGLVTLVFTDLVDSTALLQKLGDQAGATFLKQRREIIRDKLRTIPEGEEIETAGDSFLIAFSKPSDAVRFALLVQAQLRSFSKASRLSVQERIGIHLGEVVIAEGETEGKAKDLYGIQLTTAARVMSLAEGGQILLTRGVFDSARQVLKGEDIPEIEQLSWVSHGPYLLKGVDEPVEVCEVGEQAQRAFEAPKTSEKAQRQVRPDEEPVLGWRPAVGQVIPNSTQWILEEKLGEGGFGEVWLAQNPRLNGRRVFKFCFRADRVRTLKRELTLFKVLKEHVGEHPNVVRLYDVYLEEPPYYLEEEFVEGKDLATWCGSQGGVDVIPRETKLNVVAQAADALQAANDSGVIHRDVKPGNILVESGHAGQRELRTKLTDFGIGQVTSEKVLAGVTRSGLTRTLLADSSSTKTGSQLYMAPELLEGKTASTRSDLYSLGVVLYQLLVSDFGKSLTADWAEDIDEPLLQTDIQGCCAGSPQNRFAGPAQLAQRLRDLPLRRRRRQEHEQEIARKSREAYRRGVIRSMCIAAVIVGLMAGLAIIAVRQSLNAERERQQAVSAAHILRQNLYAADVKAAQQALEENNLRRAHALVERQYPTAGEEDLRGFEWRYLWNLTRSDEHFSLAAHTDTATCVAFSPVGTMLASAGNDDVVRIWDFTAQRQITSLPDLAARLNGMTFSPDGKQLAVKSESTISIFDTAQWSEVKSVETQTAGWSWHNTVLFSPDGTRLGSKSSEGFRFWKTDDWSVAETIPESRDCSSLAAISPDGSLLGLTTDAEIKLWDCAENTWRAIAEPECQRPLSMALSSNYVAVGDWKGMLHVWDLHGGGKLAEIRAHSGYAIGLAFTRNETRLVTGGGDHLLRFWQLPGLEKAGVLRGHFDEVWAAAFSPDGTMLASASKDGALKVWPSAPPADRSTFTEPARPIGFSLDSRVFVAREDEGFLQYRETTTLKAVGRVELDRNVLARGLSTDGTLEAVALPGGSIQVRTLATGSLLVGLSTGTDRRGSIAFSPRNSLLIAEGPEDTVDLWGLTGANKRKSLSGVRAPFAFSPDEELLALRGTNQTVRLWNARTWTELLPLEPVEEHSWGLSRIVISPDKRRLAVASHNSTVQLWDLETRKRLGVLFGHKAGVSDACFTLDSKNLVTASNDKTVRVWDLPTHRELLTLAVPREEMVLRLSPDETVLAVGGKAPGGELLPPQFFHAPSFAEIEAAERARAGLGIPAPSN